MVDRERDSLKQRIARIVDLVCSIGNARPPFQSIHLLAQELLWRRLRVVFVASAGRARVSSTTVQT